jgi:hypothetical protein
MTGIHVDVSRAPIVVVRFERSWTEGEFDAYLEAMETAVLSRREPTVTILDARDAMATPATQRRKQAAWLQKNEAVLRRYSLGTAFVITSPVVRGILTAILWIQPMPAPHVVVATPPEAERWATARLDERRAISPPNA